MSKTIELLPDEGVDVTATLERAQRTLDASGIITLGAADVSSAIYPRIGRILLSQSADQDRALRILKWAKFHLFVNRK